MKFISLLTIIAFGSFGLHSQNCDDLFLSAYLEDGNNKALEIYNPTSGSISLDNYSLRLYTNGNSSHQYTITFTSGATIAANDVYVVAKSSPTSTTLQGLADQFSGSMQHNGNDWYELYNGSTVIDLFGIIGNPSVQTVGTGDTEDHILTRKTSVLTGVSTWNTSEWDVHSKTSYSEFGGHTCGCHTDVRDFTTDAYSYTSAGGFFASSGGIGLWANTLGGGGNKEVFVSYQLCTDESNSSTCGSTARLMQPGDVLTFQMKGSQALGEVGVILNSSPSFAQSYSSKNSNAALELYLGGHGNNWQIVHNGSNISTSFSTSSTEKTYDVSIELTSKTTAKVTINDGSSSASYYPTLSNSNVSHLTFYLKDDWNGSSNSNFFFGSDGNDMKFENSGSLTLSNTGTYDDISDPIVPGSSSSTKSLDLIIDADITIEGDINTSGNLTVNSSDNLTLGLDGSNNYSQLKVEGSITNNGSIVHEQYISSSGHHGISSPMTAGFGTTSGTASALYEYDAASSGVYVGSYVSNGTATTSTVGRGFFAPVGSVGDFLSSAGSFTVTGTPNTSHDWTLSYVANSQSGSSDNGWNLIGNPYSATLDWNSVSVGSSVNGAVYVWDPSNDRYMSWTSAGGGVNGGSQYIPPMQAFWVQTTSGGTGTAYDISTTMSSNTLTSQSPTFQKTQNDILKLSIVNLSDNTKNDETIIAHSAGSIDGFDGKLDAWKLDNYGGNPNIYSFYVGDRLAINAVDLSIPKVIPMGIDAPQSGIVYQLNLEQIVTGNDYNVVLEDKHLNTFTDLTQGVYSYQHGGWSNNGPRFNLHVNGTNNIGIDEEEAIDNFVYQLDNEIFIHADESIYFTYQLWTIDGRLVQEGLINSSITRFVKPQSGLYLVQLKGDTANKTIKTFLK